MADIRWIKITTEMFDDEKIRIIESMPEADTLIVLWIRLICMAGKNNDNGYIYLTPEIPYTIEQLSAIFGRPLNTVKLAVETFKRLNMITLSDDGVIYLPQFEKHQNLIGMNIIRENTTRRVARFRAQKQLKSSDDNLVTRYKALQGVTDQNPLHNTNSVPVTRYKALQSVTVTPQSRVDQNIIEQKRAEELWLNVLEIIKTKINEVNYKTWLEGSAGVLIDSNTLFVGVKSDNIAEYLRNNMLGTIEGCLMSIPATTAQRVDFIKV
jgi:predicted phage replisome organizer